MSNNVDSNKLKIKENIANFLGPLSIYDLTEGSSTDKEISVYSKFLQNINDQIDDLLKEIFVQTSENYGLKIKANLLDIDISEDNLQTKREKILLSMSSNHSHFNKTNILKYLKSMGLNCEIEETIKESKEDIIISFKDQILDYQKINSFKEQVSRMLPAHLNIIFDLENKITWADLENVSFEQEQFFSWDNF